MLQGAAVTVPLHIRENSESRICFERNGTDNMPTPMINLGLSIKIPVQDLVNALLEFHKSEAIEGAKASPHEPPKPKTLSVAQLADRMNPTAAMQAYGMPHGNMPQGMPPPPPPPPPPPAAAPIRNEGWQAIPPPMPAFPNAASQRDLQDPVSWDTDISRLQPNHEEYVKRTRWKVADQRGRQTWMLENESCLTTFVPRAFNHHKVTPKDLGSLPTARPPTGTPPSSSPAKFSNEATKDAEGEGAQEGESAADAGSRTAAAGSGTTGPPMPPPGLPAPGGTGAGSGGKGAGGQQAAGQEGGKECKQQ